MSNNQDLFEESKTPLAAEPDLDDILELTDVVREGKGPGTSGDDAPLRLDDEPAPRQAGVTETSAAGDSLPGAPEKSGTGSGMEEGGSENDLSALDASEFKFEDVTPFDADDDTEPLPEQDQTQLDDVLADIEQQTDFEKPEDILAELEKDVPETETPEPEHAEEAPPGLDAREEDETPLDLPIPKVEMEGETGKPEEIAAAPEIPGMSETEMKALLTGVTRETVDRAVRESIHEATGTAIPETLEKAVRETVSEVAERAVRETVSEVIEKIIQETVDRAVRERVGDVAEKVIGEAIDALKESIASSDL